MRAREFGLGVPGSRFRITEHVIINHCIISGTLVGSEFFTEAVYVPSVAVLLCLFCERTELTTIARGSNGVRGVRENWSHRDDVQEQGGCFDPAS